MIEVRWDSPRVLYGKISGSCTPEIWDEFTRQMARELRRAPEGIFVHIEDLRELEITVPQHHYALMKRSPRGIRKIKEIISVVSNEDQIGHALRMNSKREVLAMYYTQLDIAYKYIAKRYGW